MHVADFFICHYAIRSACLSCTRRSSRSMDEKFHLGREIIVNHIFQKWNIDTSSREICDNKHFCVLFAELEKFVLSTPLIHRTIDVVWLESTFEAELVQVFNVVLSGTENYSLLAFFDMLSENVKKSGIFFTGTHDKEMQLELIWKLRVFVDLDHSIVFHSWKRELFDLRRNSGGKKHALPIGGHFLSDGLNLICETQLEETISLIVDDHLDLGQSQPSLVNAVHQTAGCRDNHIRVQQEPFKLIFHIVATDDQTVSQICILRQLLEVLGWLECKLSGRWQNDGPGAHNLTMLPEPLYNWDYKWGSFTAASSCHGNHIETLEKDWYRTSLDRCWQWVALLLDGLEELWRQVVGLETATGRLFLGLASTAFRFRIHHACLTRLKIIDCSARFIWIF